MKMPTLTQRVRRIEDILLKLYDGAIGPQQDLAPLIAEIKAAHEEWGFMDRPHTDHIDPMVEP